MKQEIVYNYADGNGNVYIVTADSLRYIPVKPSESSSGTYSGGQAREVALSAEQFENLKMTLDQTFLHRNSHTDKRVMMSGKLTRVMGKDTLSVIFKPKTQEIQVIEKAFNNYF